MRLSRLWLSLLPLLYLPNLGLAEATAFGTLEISDFLIVPYLGLVLLAVRRQGPREYQRIWPWMFGFVLVAFVSTATIWWRYPVASSHPVTSGLLKLGKLSLYGLAGVLTARALSLEGHRPRYDWALLASAAVVAAALLAMPEEVSRFAASETHAGYKATNAVSAMMAILVVYLVGRVVVKAHPGHWHRVAAWLLPLISLGFMLSKGRGGWVAALAGLVFLFYQVGVRRRVIAVLALAAASITVAYTQYPSFSEQVDKTLWPDQAYLESYGAGIAGIDDGARLVTWRHELTKVPRAAILGSGFFHRGGASGLWTTGSHNFWLQMLLETGLLGFIVLCGIGLRMWQQAGTAESRQRNLTIPVRAAFVAAFVGGLSGEYLYGGMVLFTLLAVYAPIGGLPLSIRQPRHASSAARSGYQSITS